MELKLLTIRQVSELLAINESTVRTWIRRKMFPRECILHLGNTVRFRASKLEDFLNNGCLQEA